MPPVVTFNFAMPLLTYFFLLIASVPALFWLQRQTSSDAALRSQPLQVASVLVIATLGWWLMGVIDATVTIGNEASGAPAWSMGVATSQLGFGLLWLMSATVAVIWHWLVATDDTAAAAARRWHMATPVALLLIATTNPTTSLLILGIGWQSVNWLADGDAPSFGIGIWMALPLVWFAAASADTTTLSPDVAGMALALSLLLLWRVAERELCRSPHSATGPFWPLTLLAGAVCLTHAEIQTSASAWSLDALSLQVFVTVGLLIALLLAIRSFLGSATQSERSAQLLSVHGLLLVLGWLIAPTAAVWPGLAALLIGGVVMQTWITQRAVVVSVGGWPQLGLVFVCLLGLGLFSHGAATAPCLRLGFSPWLLCSCWCWDYCLSHLAGGYGVLSGRMASLSR